MKKKSILIIIGIVFIAIVFQGIYIITHMVPNDEIIEIEYSYGGGYGTIIGTATKIITITNDGNVKLENDYESTIKTFKISKDEYMELTDFINKRKSIFTRKMIEENNVLDGTTSYIMIKLKGGKAYKIGGYMVINKKYNEIKSKINETIGQDKIKEYIKSIQE